MASLFGAVRIAANDSWWLIRLAFSVYVLFFSINYLPQYFQNPNLLILIYILVYLLFQGCAVITMSKNIDNKYPIYPGITDSPEVVKKSFGSFFVSVLGFILTSITGYTTYYFSTFVWSEYITPFRNSELDTNITDFQIIVFAILCVLALVIALLLILVSVSLIIIPLVLYAARGKLSDAFNFRIIYKALGRFCTNLIVYILSAVLVFGVSYICFYYFFMQMFGEGHITAELLKYIFSVITFFVSIIYFSELYDEVIPAVESKIEN